jgi:flagellar motor switch protein FliG
MRIVELRKAAVLMASVDARCASGLLDELTVDERKALADELDERPVTSGEQQDVAREMAATIAVIEGARPLAARSSFTARQPRVNPGAPLQPCFAFLASVRIAALARVLRLEHPQVVAVVASHLSPSAAAQVLRELPPETAASIVRRLADLLPVDPAIQDELARSLKRKLAGATRESSVSADY